MKKSWSEITINDYKRLKEISDRELDSDLEKSVGYLSVLMGVDEKMVWNRSVTELKGMLPDIEWLKEPYTFDKNWKSNRIVINEKKYDICVDINKFTVAQYADFQIYWEHRTEPEYMGKLLSCFIVPHNKKYNDGYDVLELVKTLEDAISVNTYNSICFFFLQDCVYSIKGSLLYSRYLMRKMKGKMDEEKYRELQKQLRMLTGTMIL